MHRRSESGASAVEFALLAPLLFVLTFGIIEFGLLLFDKAVLTNASREGARAAIVRAYTIGDDDTQTYSPKSESDTCEIVEAYANSYLVNLGVAGDSNLMCDPTDVVYRDEDGSIVSAPVIGGTVTVRVNYLYDFLVFPNLSRLIGGSFDGNVNLVGTTVMRME